MPLDTTEALRGGCSYYLYLPEEQGCQLQSLPGPAFLPDPVSRLSGQQSTRPGGSQPRQGCGRNGMNGGGLGPHGLALCRPPSFPSLSRSTEAPDTGSWNRKHRAGTSSRGRGVGGTPTVHSTGRGAGVSASGPGHPLVGLWFSHPWLTERSHLWTASFPGQRSKTLHPLEPRFVPHTGEKPLQGFLLVALPRSPDPRPPPVPSLLWMRRAHGSLSLLTVPRTVS